jgi:predicted transcriptional regulator
MGNRGRNEIVASILQSVINARKDDGIRTTRIMYNSFLSYSMVTHFLKLLTDNGSLEYDELNKTYTITEAGLRVLELHNKIIEMLKV